MSVPTHLVSRTGLLAALRHVEDRVLNHLLRRKVVLTHLSYCSNKLTALTDASMQTPNEVKICCFQYDTCDLGTCLSSSRGIAAACAAKNTFQLYDSYSMSAVISGK